MLPRRNLIMQQLYPPVGILFGYFEDLLPQHLTAWRSIKIKMQQVLWIPNRSLVFVLETGLDEFWRLIQSHLEGDDEFFVYNRTAYFIRADRQILSETRQRISLDGVGPSPGRFRRPPRRPEVIVFELSLAANNKTQVTAKLNLHEDRLDDIFVLLLMHLAGSSMDSEIAKAIAQEYPHDPLPPNMRQIVVVKTDLTQFLVVLNRFAARYSAEHPELGDISVEEKGLTRCGEEHWHFIARLLSHEPLEVQVGIPFEEEYFHPTLRIMLPDPRYDEVRLFLLPLTERVEVWQVPPSYNPYSPGKHDVPFVDAFLAYLHSLDLVLERRSLPAPEATPIPEPSVDRRVPSSKATPEEEPPKQSGRKRFRENDWAYIELQVKARPEDKVRLEWITFRNQLKRPRLDNILDSFEKAIAGATRLPTSTPEGGWAWTKIHLRTYARRI